MTKKTLVRNFLFSTAVFAALVFSTAGCRLTHAAYLGEDIIFSAAVNSLDLTGVIPVPVGGAEASSSGYSGEYTLGPVTWADVSASPVEPVNPVDAFVLGHTYTAAFTLSAKVGRSFSGLADGTWTAADGPSTTNFYHTGASAVVQADNTGFTIGITITFKPVQAIAAVITKDPADHTRVYNNINDRPPAFAVEAAIAGSVSSASGGGYAFAYQWYKTKTPYAGSPAPLPADAELVPGQTAVLYNPENWAWGYDGYSTGSWYYYCEVKAVYTLGGYSYTSAPVYSKAAKAQVRPVFDVEHPTPLSVGSAASGAVFYLPDADRFVLRGEDSDYSYALKMSDASLTGWTAIPGTNDWSYDYLGGAVGEAGAFMVRRYNGGPTLGRYFYPAGGGTYSATDIGNNGFAVGPYDIAYGGVAGGNGGYFLAVGESTGSFAGSGYWKPGATPGWTDAGLSACAGFDSSSARAYSVIFGEGKFVVGGDGALAYSNTVTGASPPTSWTKATGGPGGVIAGLAYGLVGAGSHRFVAMNIDGAAAWSSDGGVTWTQSARSPSSDTFALPYSNQFHSAPSPVMAYGAGPDGKGMFVAVGTGDPSANGNAGNARKVAWSEDGGETWQVYTIENSATKLSSAAYGEIGGVPTFVVYGSGGKAWALVWR